MIGLVQVREIVPAPICQPSKDCHVASSDRSAIGPTDIAHEQTPRVSNRSEEQTLNGPLQACRSLGVERPSLETLAGPANQGEGGVEDRQFVHARIPKRSHGSVLVAGSGGAEEASARLPGALGAGSTSEPPAAANDKVPRVSAEMPMECVVETLDSVGGLSEAQAGQQHLGASPEQERSTAKGPNPARSAPVDPPLDKLQGGLTLGEKACEEVPDATLQQGGSRQSGSLAPVDATPDLRQCSPSGSAIKPNSEGAPNSEALPPEGSSLRGGSSLPGGSSLELPDMSDVELAALLEHVPPPDGDALPPIDGGELWGAEQWSFLGQGLLGSFKSLPCLLSAVPAEEVVPDRNRSLKRSFSEVDALTGGGQAEKSSKCHLSKKASFVVTVPPKQPGPAVETR